MNAVCGTVIGGVFASGAALTLTRMRPVAVSSPSVTAYSISCTPTTSLCSRKVPASKSATMLTSGLAGTLLRRSGADPPRTCSSGDTVTSLPAVASTTKASATMGTDPRERTVTSSAPEPVNRPSETVRPMVLAPPPESPFV